MAKECYVLENSQDGSNQIVTESDFDAIALASNDSLNLIDVGSRYRYLSIGYLTQGVLSLIAVVYQLIALFCSDGLLRYRHFMSRLNKLFLLYGGYLLILTHCWRLDGAGKLCSKETLTEVGGALWIYLNVSWAFGGLLVVLGGFMGYGAYKMFS